MSHRNVGETSGVKSNTKTFVEPKDSVVIKQEGFRSTTQCLYYAATDKLDLVVHSQRPLIKEGSNKCATGYPLYLTSKLTIHLEHRIGNRNV